MSNHIYVPGANGQGAVDTRFGRDVEPLLWVASQFDILPLNEKERTALRSLHDALRSLRRNELRLVDLATAVPMNAFGMKDLSEAWLNANAEWQGEVFDATDAFFSNVYRALGAFAAMVSKTWKFFEDGRAPSLNSITDALRFLDTKGIYRGQTDWVIRDLEPARSFRTLLDHPQSAQPYDRATLIDADCGQPVAVTVLYGRLHPEARRPEGASDPAMIPEGAADWEFVAPGPRTVVHALVNAIALYAGRLLGHAGNRAFEYVNIDRSQSADLTDEEPLPEGTMRVTATGTDDELQTAIARWWADVSRH